MSKPSVPFHFSETLVLRTPARPASLFACTEASIRAALEDKTFQESLYISSPELYEQCIRWMDGCSDPLPSRLVITLTKYLGRMHTRCTPFGLWAGCCPVRWSDRTDIVLGKKVGKVRLDMQVLSAIGERLRGWPALRSVTRYYPNNSLYRVLDEWRYIEYTRVNHHRNYQVSSVAHSKYLQQVLEKSAPGLRLEELVTYISGFGFSLEEATEYVEGLIDSGVLLSELEESAVGEDYWHTILSVVGRIDEESAFVRSLKKIDGLLGGFGGKVEMCQAVLELIRGLGIPFEENKVFQVDSFDIPERALLDERLQESLASAFGVLNKLAHHHPNPRLVAFTRRYTERYGTRPVPLLQAIDAEMGIGYSNLVADVPAPLLDGMPARLPGGGEPDATSLLAENQVQSFLKKLLTTDAYAVTIHEKDLQMLPGDTRDLPSTMSVIFRLIESGEQDIFVEGFSGTSAVNLLGRFCYGSPEINRLVETIAAHEIQTHPGAILAEIDHLPDDRIGNILRRPAFRDYRIPIATGPGGARGKLVPLKELWIRIVGGQVRLYWEKEKKEVIPRLSTAHNYNKRGVELYQFLCDLQSEGNRTSLSFGWRVRSKFLPRVSTRNIVLSPARWTLEQADFEHLLHAKEEELMNIVRAFREKWRMPVTVLLAEGDNELLIDMDNPLMVASLVFQLKGKEGALFKEYLNDRHRGITDKEGHGYANQFVGSILLDQVRPASGAFNLLQQKEVERSFIPGSEWLYYKFYCGVQFADEILLKVIKPFFSRHQKEERVDSFFFIRYNDPDYHLRVRFHVRDLDALPAIMEDMNRRIRKFRDAGIIWRIQIDTYDREIERYGSNTIQFAEQLFYFDSLAVLRFLTVCSGDRREEFRWLWGLKAVDELLDAFAFSATDKLAIVTSVKDNFDREFQADKNVNKLFNKKYTDNRALIADVLQEQYQLSSAFKPLARILVDKRRRSAYAYGQMLDIHQKGEMETGLRELAVSIIHMFLNRHLLVQPRKHEWLMYKMLEKYYRTQLILEGAYNG